MVEEEIMHVRNRALRARIHMTPPVLTELRIAPLHYPVATSHARAKVSLPPAHPPPILPPPSETSSPLRRRRIHVRAPSVARRTCNCAPLWLLRYSTWSSLSAFPKSSSRARRAKWGHLTHRTRWGVKGALPIVTARPTAHSAFSHFYSIQYSHRS